MGFLTWLTTISGHFGLARREALIKLILIYIVGSSVALASNILLGPFAVDFSPEQLKAIIFVFFPIGISLCIIVDVLLTHTRTGR